mmetsp:Transcript_21171/g.55128  ORF Transcript_21171/g.55128 Transcript_21171/m.55128 type:complete len:136 (-) Transcript_21171:217-624(-)
MSSTHADFRASEDDRTFVDATLRSGGGTRHVVRELATFAMRGVFGSGLDMLADQTAVELEGAAGQSELSIDKARELFETLDIQVAMYRTCSHRDGEDKMLQRMAELVRIKLAGTACAARLEQLQQAFGKYGRMES